MKFDPQKHHRRSIRLRGYDYTQAGTYFVTLCTYQRECLFGEIVNGRMCLNEIGCIVAEEWLRTSEIRLEIELDEWVVMPNHIHGIIVMTESAGAHGHAPPPNHRGMPYRKPRSLSSLVAGFKSAATKRINEIRQTPTRPIWQRNYYECIIRNEKSLCNIRQYIVNNPRRWTVDSENL